MSRSRHEPGPTRSEESVRRNVENESALDACDDESHPEDLENVEVDQQALTEEEVDHDEKLTLPRHQFLNSSKESAVTLPVV